MICFSFVTHCFSRSIRCTVFDLGDGGFEANGLAVGTKAGSSDSRHVSSPSVHCALCFPVITASIVPQMAFICPAAQPSWF